MAGRGGMERPGAARRSPFGNPSSLCCYCTSICRFQQCWLVYHITTTHADGVTERAHTPHRNNVAFHWKRKRMAGSGVTDTLRSDGGWEGGGARGGTGRWLFSKKGQQGCPGGPTDSTPRHLPRSFCRETPDRGHALQWPPPVRGRSPQRRLEALGPRPSRAGCTYLLTRRRRTAGRGGGGRGGRRGGSCRFDAMTDGSRRTKASSRKRGSRAQNRNRTHV